MYSIRDRLLWTFCIALLVAGVAATYMTFISARAELDRFLDAELQQSTHSFERVPDTVAVPADEQRIIVQITGLENNRSYLSAELESPFPVIEQEGLATILHEGRTWRIFNLKTETGFNILTAQPTDVRLSMAFGSALHILQPLVLLLPFLVIAVWLLVSQGLASLNRKAKIGCLAKCCNSYQR